MRGPAEKDWGCDADIVALFSVLNDASMNNRAMDVVFSLTALASLHGGAPTWWIRRFLSGFAGVGVMAQPPHAGDIAGTWRMRRLNPPYNVGFEYQGVASLDVQHEVLKGLDEVLSLNGRTHALRRESPLLGAVPELDSMAVVSLITTLEERFGFTVADDELDASAFSTVGALADFVSAKMNS